MSHDHHFPPPCKHVIQVPVIVNRNEAQVLVVTEIPLTPPAFKIDEIQKLIEIDDSLSGQGVVGRTREHGRPPGGTLPQGGCGFRRAFRLTAA